MAVSCSTAVSSLSGSSWGHARGHTSLVAASARYADEHGVEVTWTPRTLTEFGLMDVAVLARKFDLVVIDHPHAGDIAVSGSLLALDRLVAGERLRALGDRSPGRSHQSYAYDGHQWALAIDAACHVAAWRPDRLDAAQLGRWDAVVELAREGRVVWPLGPVDALSSFLTVTAELGTPLRVDADVLIDPEGGVAALETIHRVARHLSPRCFELDAIEALEILARTEDEAAYCPLVFGYTNYARDGFRGHRLRFGAPVRFAGPERGHGPLLGGVGLGVSSHAEDPEAAAEFALWLAGPDAQRTTFFDGGGQPAHVAAWEDPELDRSAGGFFSDTRATLDRSWLRPRAPGFAAWQSKALSPLHQAIRSGAGFESTIAHLNALAREKRPNSFHGR